MLSRHCAVSVNNVEISWKLIFWVHILESILPSVNCFWSKKTKYHIIWLFSAKVDNKQYSKKKKETSSLIKNGSSWSKWTLY